MRRLATILTLASLGCASAVALATGYGCSGSSGGSNFGRDGGSSGGSGSSNGSSGGFMMFGDGGSSSSSSSSSSGGGVPCPSGLMCNVSCTGGTTTTISGKVYDPAMKN